MTRQLLLICALFVFSCDNGGANTDSENSVEVVFQAIGSLPIQSVHGKIGKVGGETHELTFAYTDLKGSATFVNSEPGDFVLEISAYGSTTKADSTLRYYLKDTLTVQTDNSNLSVDVPAVSGALNIRFTLDGTLPIGSSQVRVIQGKDSIDYAVDKTDSYSINYIKGIETTLKIFSFSTTQPIQDSLRYYGEQTFSIENGKQHTKSLTLKPVSGALDIDITW